MSRSAFTFVTGNPDKLREARRVWPGTFDALELDLPEIQSLDLAVVLGAKADVARRSLAGPLVVEETGLELAALGGFPGPLVKWMLTAVGAEGVARTALALGDPRATARCMLLYDDGARRIPAQGETRGSLTLPPRGEGGFGWDPVFEPEGESRTYGELPAARKDAIGHRGRAWRSLREALLEAGIALDS